MSTTDLTTFENIFQGALKMPGIKVNRTSFLEDAFEKKYSNETLTKIIKVGPVEAGIPRHQLKKIAQKYINKRTLGSSTASFLAGIPGGFTMAATIPADVLQFFAISLRLAQELAYLYGVDDLFSDDDTLNENSKSKMILYLGVMLGASGASEGIRIISARLSTTVLKKLPQKALTKTLIYPLVKKIASYLGIKITKDSFAKGISKIIPVIGGVLSGGITFATLKPMGKKLQKELDYVAFDYTESDLMNDIDKIQAIYDIEDVDSVENLEDVVVIDEVAITEEVTEETSNIQTDTNSNNLLFEQINEAHTLFEKGVINKEEFNNLKNIIIKNAIS